jgi:hypothetical protein
MASNLLCRENQRASFDSPLECTEIPVTYDYRACFWAIFQAQSGELICMIP